MSAISPRAMLALGWKRVDAARGKIGAVWLHAASGWRLAHCGHPTALYPWALVRPDNRLVCTGVTQGHPPNCGRAWPTLRAAAEWYASFLASGAELAADRGASHWWSS